MKTPRVGSADRVDHLITLPLRVWLRATRFALRPATGVAKHVISLAGYGAPADVAPDVPMQPPPDRNGRAPDVEQEATEAEPAEPEAADSEAPATKAARFEPAEQQEGEEDRAADEVDPREQPQPEAARPSPAGEPDPPAPPLTEPDHVTEGAEIVAETADPGAEDGAGAQLQVDQPWDGYGDMTAPDIVERVAVMSREEIAVVELYESVHRQRRDVLDAMKKRLEQLNT
jgi:hypothetical protein